MSGERYEKILVVSLLCSLDLITPSPKEVHLACIVAEKEGLQITVCDGQVNVYLYSLGGYMLARAYHVCCSGPSRGQRCRRVEVYQESHLCSSWDLDQQLVPSVYFRLLLLKTKK